MGKWEMAEIKDGFSLVTRGKTPSYIEESNIRVINQACIYWDRINLSNVKYQDPSKNKKAIFVEPGDLLINSTGTGTLGRCNVFNIVDEYTYIIDTHVTLLRSNEHVLPSFVRYYFSMDETQGEIYRKCVSGSTNQIELSKKQLLDLSIPLPPLPVQQKISDVLDRASDLIKKRKAQIDKLDLLVKSQFVEMFGDPGINPNHWEMQTVQQLIDSEIIEKPLDGNHGELHPKNSDYQTSGIPFIMANHLTDGRINFEKCNYISEAFASKLRKGFARKGDVLLTHKGTIGRTGIITGDFEYVILTPQITYYRIVQKLSNLYLKSYFDMNYFQKQLANIAEIGSTRQYIGITEQTKLAILLPPLKLQNQFADFVQQVEAQKSLLQQSLAKLELYYKSLMQKCFRGEIF